MSLLNLSWCEFQCFNKDLINFEHEICFNFITVMNLNVFKLFWLAMVEKKLFRGVETVRMEMLNGSIYILKVISRKKRILSQQNVSKFAFQSRSSIFNRQTFHLNAVSDCFFRLRSGKSIETITRKTRIYSSDR